MHRIPLLLNTPSISWDRNLPEYVLFDKTLNHENVIEMDCFLTILDNESDTCINQLLKWAAGQYERAQVLLADNNVLEEDNVALFAIFNNLVLRAPKQSPALAFALKYRGFWYLRRHCLEGAKNDLEMYLSTQLNSTDNFDLCQIYSQLAIATYLMRQYENSKNYIQLYQKYKTMIPPELFINTNLEKVDTNITLYMHELDVIDNLVPKYSVNNQFRKPFKGYNTIKDIPASSSACYYISQESNSYNKAGVFAKCKIPKGSIVLLEQPTIKEAATPYMQCEFCLQCCDQAFTCFDCRYKAYCSMKCIESDKELHQIECIGYKNLLLLHLDARSLFRTFLHISKSLYIHIFTHKSFRKLKTAAMVLSRIDAIDENDYKDIQYLTLINKKPNYHHLADMKYATLVATAFRLTMFIEKKTLVIESFYKGLRNLSNKQKLIVVGSILMRLHGHLLTNTFDFEWGFPKDSIKPAEEEFLDEIDRMADLIKPINGYDTIGSADEYYQINDDEISILNNQVTNSESYSKIDELTLGISEPCNNIQRPLSLFKDNVIERIFNPKTTQSRLDYEITKDTTSIICGRISKMTSMERCTFVKHFVSSFHYSLVAYFVESPHTKSILTLFCPTLRKFRHSCKSNVEVVVTDDGVVMGKTIRDIEADEELSVSHKATSKRHIRAERMHFLKELGVKCDCLQCAMPESEEPINLQLGVYCDICGVELTPALAYCSKCSTSYDKLMSIYKPQISILDKEIKSLYLADEDAYNERNLFMIHNIANRFIKHHLTPSNEYRLYFELLFAKFLAFKNFARQSCQIIMEVDAKLKLHYDVSAILFSLYPIILEVINIILHNHIDKRLSYLAPVDLLQLCKIGLNITNLQNDDITLRETFDYDGPPILGEIKKLNEWREKILLLDIAAKFSLNKVFAAKCHPNGDIKNDDSQEMPTLLN